MKQPDREENLLEIGELSDLHAIHPDFPTQSPSTKDLNTSKNSRNKQLVPLQTIPMLGNAHENHKQSKQRFYQIHLVI